MPMDKLMQEQLKEIDESIFTPSLVLAAHQFLLSEGYEFVGYHGTNYAYLQSIVPYNFDPKFIGSGSGTARGDGFYASLERALADDYAQTSTQSEDPIPPNYEVQKYPDERGQARTLRIYAKHFSSMEVGVDYKWGIQSTCNDPNGDLNIITHRGRKINNIRDVELLLCATVYKDLAAIPSYNAQLDRILEEKRPQWNVHTIDERYSKLLGAEQPRWYLSTPVPPKRRNSDPTSLTVLHKLNYAKSSSPLSFVPSAEQDYEMGLKYYHELGVAENMKKAAQFFKKAADKGHAGAQEKLADIYENGRNVTPNIEEAVRLYQLAAKQGEDLALFSLGQCCENGKGVTQNFLLAAKFYKAAFDHGYEGWEGYFNKFMERHPELQDTLSTINSQEGLTSYFNELEFVKNTPNNKDLFLEKEQRKENLYQAGLKYYHRDIEPGVDMKKAAQFFKIAAIKGHAGAQEKLADIYENGRNVTPNIEEAVRLYQLAAKQGEDLALFSLGQCCENGKGVTQNFLLAAKFYKAAFDRGYEGWEGYFNKFMERHPEIILNKFEPIDLDQILLSFKEATIGYQVKKEKEEAEEIISQLENEKEQLIEEMRRVIYIIDELETIIINAEKEKKEDIQGLKSNLQQLNLKKEEISEKRKKVAEELHFRMFNYDSLSPIKFSKEKKDNSEITFNNPKPILFQYENEANPSSLQPQAELYIDVRKVFNIPHTFIHHSEAQSVHIAGDFNDWLKPENGTIKDNDKWLMKNIDSNTWQLTASLPAGKHQFKYVINKGERWERDFQLPYHNDERQNSSLLINELYEIDVTADGACLFYSVTFAYLLPIVEDVTEFKNRFVKLFGKEIESSAEENRKRLLLYDGSAEFIQRHANNLDELVNVNLRKRLVEFMKSNYELFTDFIPKDEFETYVYKMGDPSKKEWGSQPEIVAMSQFLQIRITVCQNKNEQIVPEPDADDHGVNCSNRIYLIHTTADKKETNAKNHYHFLVAKQFIRNTKVVTTTLVFAQVKDTYDLEKSAMTPQFASQKKFDSYPYIDETTHLDIAIATSLEAYQQKHGSFESDSEREAALERFRQEWKEEAENKKKKTYNNLT